MLVKKFTEYTGVTTITTADIYIIYVLNRRNISPNCPVVSRYLRDITILPPPSAERYIDDVTLWTELKHKLDYKLCIIDKLIEPYVDGDVLEYLEALPFRTKDDRNIRRTSIAPIFKAITSDKLKDLLKTNHMDQITVQNVLIWCLFTNFSFVDHLIAFSFLSSFEWVAHIGGEITKLVKKRTCDPNTRVKFAEMGGLCGYRNPPVPGFDFDEKVNELVDAGFPHGLEDWELTYHKSVDEVMETMVPVPIDSISFLEFIRLEKANTAGASSEGQVQYEFENKLRKFKARKNYLLDIYTPEQIVAKCREHGGKSVQKPFTKAELGKIRIAVTGDVWNYLIQSYVFYYVNHAYTQADWNSLEENGEQELKRLWDTLKELFKKYSLPYDYDKYDHQPQMFEILALVLKLCKLALAQDSGNEDLQWACDMFLMSTRSSEAIWTNKGVRHRREVVNGVQSGIRATSVLGNLWNAVMTNIVRHIINALTFYFQKNQIRGDDSAIYAKKYYDCLMTAIAYQAINAKGNPYKFGILYENTEFLRVWSSAERNYGYLCRSIPGISQRKPWSSEPDDMIFGNIRNSIESLNICVRRLGSGSPELRQQLAIEWSRRNRQSYVLLETPPIYGGPGILEFRGRVSVPRSETTNEPKPSITFIPHPDTYVRYYDEFSEFNPSIDELRQIQQIRMMARAKTDDIPDIVTPLRTYEKSLLRSRRYDIVHVTLATEKYDYGFLIDPVSFHDIKTDVPLMFGSYSSYEKYFTTLRDFSRVRKINVMDTMLKKYPDFVYTLRHIERKFGFHRTLAIDYLFGKLSALVILSMNSKFVSILSSVMAKELIKAPSNRRKMKELFVTRNLEIVSWITNSGYYRAVGQH